MTRLIQVAPNCSIVTGPGRIELVQSLTPIFNFYALPQLDYATAEDFLTTQGTMYPYYMRTVPDNSYIYSVHAAVCSYFAWERVIIMTSNDTVGTNRARSMQNKLQRQGVYVEQVYYIQDVARNEISKTFVDIYAYAVSRIIILLFSLHGDDADMFYNLIDEYSYMTNYVFFLGRELCMYGYTHPSARAKLQSSICALPYVSSAKLDELNKHIFDDTPKGRVSQDGDVQNSVSEEVERLLRSGGFASMVSKCRTESIRNFSAFAVDAAYSIITASEQAQALQKNLNKCGGLDNSTSHPNGECVDKQNNFNYSSYLRNHSFDGLTGVFTIKADGSRPSADFAVDIAVSNVTLQFGIWQDSASPHFRANVQDNQWLWMTNTTSVPLDTFRDMSFLLRSSLSTSPFTIVLCIVGFVGTLTIFSIWYNHFIVQKRMEATLKSNAVPVTEEELQMLRKGSSVV